MQREGFAVIPAHRIATDQGRKGPLAPTRAASALDLENIEARWRAPATAMSNITMSSTITHSDLHWKQADDHVYVATRDGEFAGFVELAADAHVAHDGRGAELGSFPTLVEARRALEGTPRRSIRSIRQTLRRHLSRVRA